MTINGLINSIINNKEWLFSGLGLFTLTGVIALISMLHRTYKSHKSNLNNSTVREEDMREIEKLVVPLHSNIGNKSIFLKKNFGYENRNGERVKEYLEFWDNIEQSKHLGSPKLRLAIDDYKKSKSEKISDKSYEMAETEFYEVIRKRYSELNNQYSNSRNFDTKSIT